jgi:glyoxylase-like metal-dependent hydrolase (beta-lactamase superfamily II)
VQGRLKIGEFELIWLNGGRFELDGGAMFGVVPKVLWSKKYPCDSENYIPMTAWPILVKTPEAHIIIETGLGNKLSEKQKKIFRVREDWDLPRELESLGIGREDIDYVVLSHYDFDHAGGVVMLDEAGQQALTFPKARHLVQKREWEDVLNPNIRSINTFWPINNELLRGSGLLELIDGEVEVVKGVRAVLTGGHNRGHQIVRIASGGQLAVHLADLLPTHAHFNPLWIMAYDNFPLESIGRKEELEGSSIREGAWFTFYHDAVMVACRFDDKGNVIETVTPDVRET